MAIDQYYENGVDVGAVAAQPGQSQAVAVRCYRQATKGSMVSAIREAGIVSGPRATWRSSRTT